MKKCKHCFYSRYFAWKGRKGVKQAVDFVVRLDVVLLLMFVDIENSINSRFSLLIYTQLAPHFFVELIFLVFILLEVSLSFRFKFRKSVKHY